MLPKIDKKLCLLIIASALLTSGLIWLAVFWQFGRIREISDNIQKEQLNSLVGQQRSQKVLELKKELGDVGQAREEINALLIDKENAVPFLETLEGIGRATGNTINISVTDLAKMKSQFPPQTQASQDSDDETVSGTKKSSPPKKETNTKKSPPDFSNQLGFTVELNGEFRSLVDFLTKLENIPYFVQVYNFQVSPAAKKQISQAGTVNESQSSSEGEQSPNGDTARNITAILTISVYTNGTK